MSIPAKPIKELQRENKSVPKNRAMVGRKPRRKSKYMLPKKKKANMLPRVVQKM